ncbi:MAG: ABC transporter ATP-binding protein, partial [Parasporobacterium sp.]|nr:ABC transporter ATP-binding protein [Parasporobacterium sp.]
MLKEMFQKFIGKDWKLIFHELKWVFRYIRRYRLQVVLYSALGVVSVLFSLLSSVVSRNLIDAVTGFNHDSIFLAAAAYVGFGLGTVIINIITGKISMLIGTKVSNEISADIFDQVLYTDWESVSDYTAGDLLQRINGDAGSISNSVLTMIPNALNALVRFIGAFIILVSNDPIMALISLAGVPVTFLSGSYRLKNSKKFMLESRQLASKRSTFNNETFQNLQTIKAFGVLSDFSQRMKDIQQEILQLSIRKYNYQAWTTILTSVTGLVVGYACYGFAVYRLWNGSISFGTMTLLVGMAASLSGSFGSVVRIFPSAVSTATAAERVMEIVEMPREEYEDAPVVDAIKAQAENEGKGISVNMKDVTFAYKDGREVFAEGSFEAHPGEIVALVGPSGQGKTTTLRLLLGLIFPQKGDIEIGIDDCVGDNASAVQTVDNEDCSSAAAAGSREDPAFFRSTSEVDGKDESLKTAAAADGIAGNNAGGEADDKAGRKERPKNRRTVIASPASRRLFCYVPQGNTMFYGTIAENLRMVKPEASDEELQHVLELADAWEFVQKLPDTIYAQVGQRGQGISEGQAQRIAIARSILADAPILLLDEATSALD